jgi:hypothetical protein
LALGLTLFDADECRMVSKPRGKDAQQMKKGGRTISVRPPLRMVCPARMARPSETAA